jgi:hypothetical protein
MQFLLSGGDPKVDLGRDRLRVHAPKDFIGTCIFPGKSCSVSYLPCFIDSRLQEVSDLSASTVYLTVPLVPQCEDVRCLRTAHPVYHWVAVWGLGSSLLCGPVVGSCNIPEGS